MKKIGLVVLLIGLSVATGGTLSLVKTRVRVKALQSSFTTLSAGMAKDEVIVKTGNPDSITLDKVAYWDSEPLPSSTREKIKQTFVYVVPTFFLPINFELSFEAQGRLVAKHRYD